MIILGIETSCDDTGIAIIRTTPRKGGVKFDILSNIVSSQIKVHQKYGGVVPNLAAREHLKNIEPCLRQAFQKTNLKLSNTRLDSARQVDLIAVTVGPGLIPSLLIGVHFAKALAYKLQKPIVGINHIEAHIIAGLAAINNKNQEARNKQIPITKIQNTKLFPAIALVVSGGHTQLIFVNPFRNQRCSNGIKSIKKYKIIGETRDDAAGECFDKVAKLLGLSYPGGPAIADEAARCKTQDTRYKLPRPMINHKNYDFSFSGLKTAVLYTIKDSNKINIPALCYEAQQAIIDVLISKTIRAAKSYKAKTIILAGGVAANKELRKQFQEKIQDTRHKIQTTNFLVPSKNLCTDNGAMIAMAGYFNKEKATKNYDKIKANANLRIG